MLNTQYAMLPFYAVLAAFVIFGFKALKKPAMIIAALWLIWGLVSFEEAALSKANIRQQLGLPPDELSFSVYAVQSALFIIFWTGLAYWVGRIIAKIAQKIKKPDIPKVLLICACLGISACVISAPSTAHAESKRPAFDCTVKELTPVQHWYVSCENETYRGHITTLEQLDTGARYWSGFVYRVEAGRISDPFINIVVKAAASPDGKRPPEKIHCIWIDEEVPLTNCS